MWFIGSGRGYLFLVAWFVIFLLLWFAGTLETPGCLGLGVVPGRKARARITGRTLLRAGDLRLQDQWRLLRLHGARFCCRGRYSEDDGDDRIFRVTASRASRSGGFRFQGVSSETGRDAQDQFAAQLKEVDDDMQIREEPSNAEIAELMGTVKRGIQVLGG